MTPPLAAIVQFEEPQWFCSSGSYLVALVLFFWHGKSYADLRPSRALTLAGDVRCASSA